MDNTGILVDIHILTNHIVNDAKIIIVVIN